MTEGDPRKKKLCRHVTDPEKYGPCPHKKSGKCAYCHDRRCFDKDGKWIGKKRGKGKKIGATEEGGASSSWDLPVGIGAGPQQLMTRGLSAAQKAAEEQGWCVPHKTAIQKGEAAKEVAGQSAKEAGSPRPRP